MAQTIRWRPFACRAVSSRQPQPGSRPGRTFVRWDWTAGRVLLGAGSPLLERHGPNVAGSYPAAVTNRLRKGGIYEPQTFFAEVSDTGRTVRSIEADCGLALCSFKNEGSLRYSFAASLIVR